jgi:phosphoribosyl-ATP pyrophosphohydrolase
VRGGGIDSQTRPRAFASTSSPATRTARATRRDTLDWVREVQERGAGEIVLNCMASDGVRRGYDLRSCGRARGLPRAAGRLGRRRRARRISSEVFRQAGVDGALAASVFHTGVIAIFIKSLEATIARRIADSPEGSYTARLYASGVSRIAQKVGEEGVETALAAVTRDDDQLVGECADLLYHLLVLLKARNLSIDRVVQELASRHASKA